MNIILNNRPETFDAKEMSIEEIIKFKNFTFKLLVTKINNVFVPKEKRSITFVKDGDNLVVLHLISGG